jgi:hypothetical protein
VGMPRRLCRRSGQGTRHGLGPERESETAMSVPQWSRSLGFARSRRALELLDRAGGTRLGEFTRAAASRLPGGACFALDARAVS